jgi:hypothetical protein
MKETLTIEQERDARADGLRAEAAERAGNK